MHLFATRDNQVTLCPDKHRQGIVWKYDLYAVMGLLVKVPRNTYVAAGV